MLFEKINEFNAKEKTEDNLFVKNVIINRGHNNKIKIPYIATERWINQLGKRLETKY